MERSEVTLRKLEVEDDRSSDRELLGFEVRVEEVPCSRESLSPGKAQSGVKANKSM